MKRTIKLILIAGAIVLLGYNSVYIKPLNEIQQASLEFDASKFSDELWTEKFPGIIEQAVAFSEFKQGVAVSPEETLEKHTHAVAIGNYRYALIRTEAKVVSIDEDDVKIEINDGEKNQEAILATEFIYGNAVRDACGLIDAIRFPDTDKLNGVSSSLNNIVREKVIGPFRNQVNVGDKIEVTAAIEINREQISWKDLELFPVKIQIL